MQLVRLAKRHKVTYSRYADDITFSTNQKYFPNAIASEEPTEKGKWVLGPELLKRLAAAGFTVNNDKTRMHLAVSRQTVTGLVVNSKVNVSAEYFRNAKTMCHSLLKTGRYYARLVPAKVGGTEQTPDWTSNPNHLQGILDHIDLVKRLSPWIGQ
jgi:retron-type reverse transcriptase